MMMQNDKPIAPKTTLTIASKKKPSLRLRRAINAIASRYPHGGVTREALDRICGSTNSPDLILQLRNDYIGHDGVICKKIDGIDRDGQPCKVGLYSFSDAGYQHILELGLYHG